MCILPLKPIIVASEAIAAAAVISELSTTTSCSNDPSLWLLYVTTWWMEWMSHRTWRLTKQQPSMLPGPAVPGCCLVYFCFLCDIHSIHSVHYGMYFQLRDYTTARAPASGIHRSREPCTCTRTRRPRLPPRPACSSYWSWAAGGTYSPCNRSRSQTHELFIPSIFLVSQRAKIICILGFVASVRTLR